MKALVIEDDSLCALGISKTLEQHGINCDICHMAEDAIYMSEASLYDVVIVDIGLPDMSGNEIIKKIRSSTKNDKKNTPILVLSNLGKSEEKVESFMYGADDFVVKPYDTKEFIMRVLTAIRRSNGHCENKIIIGELALDVKEKLITIKNKPIKLSSKEYKLMQLLIMKKNNTLSKEEILDSLYCGEEVPGQKIVDVLICKIRKKIQEYTDHKYLVTAWGDGYKIASPSLEDESEAEIINLSA